MALTVAERQARWRERHIRKRREAQRIVNLLARKSLTDEVIREIAAILNQFLNREGVRTLRRELSERRESRPIDQDMMTTIELLKTEKAAWECDHQGQEYPEHECSLPDRESTDLARWRRQRHRNASRPRR
jgi:hypothetical protein